MTDSPAGNYNSAVLPASTLTTAITSTSFSLITCPNPVLTFRHVYALAKLGSSQDPGRLEISTNTGATWNELARYSGGGIFGQEVEEQDMTSPEWANINWQVVEIGLGSYTGTVCLQFNLVVDQKASTKGWVVDNVIVKAGASSTPGGAVYLPIILKGS